MRDTLRIREQILEVLRVKGPMPVARIVDATGLDADLVRGQMSALRYSGEVVKKGRDERGCVLWAASTGPRAERPDFMEVKE